MSDKRKISRTRNFATVIYPDSCPANFLDIISNIHISCFVSPLHDKDISADGNYKKPHYHVLFAFDSVKTIEQASEIIDLISGVGCENIVSFRSYARYLCHLDDPDKFQYSISDVKQFGGIDYNEVISTSSDRYAAFEEMMDFCSKYHVTSFYLLSMYARTYRSDWFRILCDSGTIFMKEFLKSFDWSSKNDNLSIIDQESGEVIL